MSELYTPNHLCLLPDLQMLSDELEKRCQGFDFSCPEEAPGFTSFQIYSGQQTLQDDVLYVLGEISDGFPVDEHPYISSGRIDGKAPHISGLEIPETELINELLSIFRR